LHVVAVIALPGVVPFDLAIPCGVFGRAASGNGAYDVRVCGQAKTVRAAHFDLRLAWGLDVLQGATTVIVPGVDDVTASVSSLVLQALRDAAARGARIASICTGAFVLAAAGLLDGRRATTHWLAAPLLAQRYPLVHVDPNVLFVDEGDVLTSAGAAAGFDLCLYMLRRDLGATAASEAARMAVMPLERQGGQAQFITRPPPTSSSSLAPFLLWLGENLKDPLSLSQMARQAGASSRTFSRRFRQQTGTTPLQWLLTARVRRAQSLLESTDLTVERVATESGFESSAAFRDRFRRIVGLSPTDYRRSFATASSEGPSARVRRDGARASR
jgi:transcriptional regulator GlxA family with amidase domain